MSLSKYIILSILLFIVPCLQAQSEFKSFYYPLGEEDEVKIYKYVNKNSPEYIEYWKVTTNPKTNKLTTESYGTNFKLYNTFIEEFKSNGAELVEYIDFKENNEGHTVKVIGDVIDSHIYKWKDKSKYRYSVKYRTPKYGREQFIKQRTFNRYENIEINGTQYSTVKFMDEYEMIFFENNWKAEFYQFTYYAKGIGMVKYQRYIPNEEEIDLQLVEILTENQFNELIRKAGK